jgi:DNA polymerase-3 subunit alpha
MGKKKMDVMRSMQEEFIEGAKKLHNIGVRQATEIFSIMEKFAAYGFNRSHSAAYSVVAYQTAYLKAHHPSEYMASVLSHNQNNIDKITFFMDECRRMGIKVLGPDINHSSTSFTVNEKDEILFGLGAIKGTGDAAVEAIIVEREENGAYADIFDFASRVNLRTANKKTFESLAMSGAFDGIGDIHRRQYLYSEDNGTSLIEKAIKYGNKSQAEKNASQQSLFGGSSGESLPLPRIEQCEPFTNIEKLKIEKDVVGFYITGHPLDQYRFELKHFCNTNLGEFSDLSNLKGKEIRLGGIVSSFAHRITKKGKPFGILTIEDYESTYSFYLFSDDYLKYKKYFETDWFLFIRGLITPRKWNENELEFKIQEIDLLGEVREKYLDGIELFVDIGDITDTFISKISDLAENNPGKGSLLFNITDSRENLKVDMFSRKIRIGITNDFIGELESMPGMEYKVLMH